MGKPYPQYHAYSDAVSLTIFSSIEDVEFVKFIVQEQDKMGRLLSLAELIILRYLTDNKRVLLSEVQEITQMPIEDAKKSCMKLVKEGLIELAGKEYMLTAKVYEAIKSDVEYTQDRLIRYIKAKDRILEYLQSEAFITNEKIRELCGYTRQQARTTVEKMQKEELIVPIGKGRGAKYVLSDK